MLDQPISLLDARMLLRSESYVRRLLCESLRPTLTQRFFVQFSNTSYQRNSPHEKRFTVRSLSTINKNRSHLHCSGVEDISKPGRIKLSAWVDTTRGSSTLTTQERWYWTILTSCNTCICQLWYGWSCLWLIKRWRVYFRSAEANSTHLLSM